MSVGLLSTYVTFEHDSHWGVWSFLILAALLAALTSSVGLGLTGRLDGALMDHRYRISLAQLQIAVWTFVVLGAWGAAVFANLGINEGSSAFEVSIPSELWLALGISATTFGGAKLIQARDAATPPVRPPPAAEVTLIKRGESLARWEARGKLLTHRGPSDANWGDLFAADGTDAGAVPDISKIQMFFFTIVLAFGYGVACVDLFATHSSGAISGLPPLNEAFVIILGISQGSYLVKKTVDLRI
ncbi:MAG TPA: hypothetical protein VG144_09680 [Gaiellaceae bacterium]|nr:hypothetical protein [Gaiellaceae bacterium]